QAQVLERVVQLADSGLGIIISTHDPDHAFAFASRVLVLHEGAVIADGPPADILTSERLELIYGVGVEIERLENGRRVCVPRLAMRRLELTRCRSARLLPGGPRSRSRPGNVLRPGGTGVM